MNHWHVGGHVETSKLTIGGNEKKVKDIKETVKDNMGEDLEKLAVTLLKEKFNVENFTITRSQGYYGHENELTIHTNDGKKVTITIQK